MGRSRSTHIIITHATRMQQTYAPCGVDLCRSAHTKRPGSHRQTRLKNLWLFSVWKTYYQTKCCRNRKILYRKWVGECVTNCIFFLYVDVNHGIYYFFLRKIDICDEHGLSVKTNRSNIFYFYFNIIIILYSNHVYISCRIIVI